MTKTPTPFQRQNPDEDRYGDPEHWAGPTFVRIFGDRYSGVWSINLPHQCGDWVIGGPEEARLMASHLLEAADEYERLMALPEVERRDWYAEGEGIILHPD